MNDHARAMVLASFVADALSLGVHWIYNTNVIDKKWGRVEGYIKPERPTYHPTKNIGELTHYGDQTLLLLESIASNASFDINRFASHWQDFFKTYEGYFDGATKATLENFTAGKSPLEAGSESDDLAGASRISPLAYRYRNDPENLITAARAQTALTHNNPTVIETAEFFGRVVLHVLDGQAPTSAINQILEEKFNRDPYVNWVTDGLNSAGSDTRQTILDFGQMCEVEAAFPCAIHLIARYESNLKEGLIENAMAGGDSAGRGLIAGMVLGAHLGIDAIPKKWLKELRPHQKIVELMDEIDRYQT
jgi:ADP-ribosylglycohydrolase